MRLIQIARASCRASAWISVVAISVLNLLHGSAFPHMAAKAAVRGSARLARGFPVLVAVLAKLSDPELVRPVGPQACQAAPPVDPVPRASELQVRST